MRGASYLAKLINGSGPAKTREACEQYKEAGKLPALIYGEYERPAAHLSSCRLLERTLMRSED
jgi:ribosomal protein L25 (general stress protein Ctc)